MRRLIQPSQVVEIVVPGIFAFLVVLATSPGPDAVPWIAFGWAPVATWAFVRKTSDDSRVLGIAYRRGRPFRLRDLAAQSALLLVAVALAAAPVLHEGT